MKFVVSDENTSILIIGTVGSHRKRNCVPSWTHVIETMRKAANNTIDPRAYDPLIQEGFIRQTDLVKAIQESLNKSTNLESLLIENYRVPKAVLGKTLSTFFDCPYIPYDERTLIDPQLLNNLSHDYLRRHHWLPLKQQGEILDVLIDNPHDLDRGHDIRRSFSGLTIRYALGLQRDIERFLSATIGDADSGSIADTLGKLVNDAHQEQGFDIESDGIDENDSAIVRLANQIIAEAYKHEASDIHVEPYSDRKETAIRFRMDGTCSTYMRIPAIYRRALVSRIKIMSNLDIAERRKPQDGKIRFKLNQDKEIELRVATLPTAGIMKTLSCDCSRRGSPSLSTPWSLLRPRSKRSWKSQRSRTVLSCAWAQPDPERRRPCMPCCVISTQTNGKSGRRKTPSRSPRKAFGKCRSIPKLGLPLPPLCGRSYAPTLMSS